MDPAPNLTSALTLPLPLTLTPGGLLDGTHASGVISPAESLHSTRTLALTLILARALALALALVLALTLSPSPNPYPNPNPNRVPTYSWP